MSKQKTKEESLKLINNLVDKQQNKVAKDFRGLLYKLKSSFNYNDAELATIFNTTEDNIYEIMREAWVGVVPMDMLYRMSIFDDNFVVGDISVNNKTYSRETINSMLESFHNKPMTRKEKIDKILDCFGVDNDTDLDNLLEAVERVRNITLQDDGEDNTTDNNTKNTMEFKNIGDCGLDSLIKSLGAFFEPELKRYTTDNRK